MFLSGIQPHVAEHRLSDGGSRPILSGTAQYALRAVVHLARHGDGGPVTASELAEAAEVPQNYMGKILHELVRSGILTSVRGKRGGFQLAVASEALPLIRVVSSFDRLGTGRRCLLGRPECSDADPCAAHGRWSDVAESIDEFFQVTTVADVLQD